MCAFRDRRRVCVPVKKAATKQRYGQLRLRLRIEIRPLQFFANLVQEPDLRVHEQRRQFVGPSAVDLQPGEFHFKKRQRRAVSQPIRPPAVVAVLVLRQSTVIAICAVEVHHDAASDVYVIRAVRMQDMRRNITVSGHIAGLEFIDSPILLAPFVEVFPVDGRRGEPHGTRVEAVLGALVHSVVHETGVPSTVRSIFCIYSRSIFRAYIHPKINKPWQVSTEEVTAHTYMPVWCAFK